MTKRPVVQIPFDGHGNQLHYPSGYEPAYYPEEFQIHWGEFRDKYGEDAWRAHIDKRRHWEEHASKITFRDNCEFEADVRFIGFSRGRSAATFYLEDQSHHKYAMFAHLALEVMQNCNFKEGWSWVYRWTFVKKGANFSLKLVLD